LLVLRPLPFEIASQTSSQDSKPLDGIGADGQFK
jgi:hypothetical protein